MFFGISGGEFIVLLAVAAIVLGPERLPGYAQQLARLIRELRRLAQGASAQVRAEMGPEFDDIDWSKLDPRQYDPRRILREALADSFDPDDPLGLKDAERTVRSGLSGGGSDTGSPENRMSRESPDGDRPSRTGSAGPAEPAEKPVSRGGPATVTPAPGPAVEPAAEPAASVGFDPDAT